MQTEHLEGIAQQQVLGLGAIALAPVLGTEELGAGFGRAMHHVEKIELVAADQLIVLTQHDGKGEIRGQL